MRGLLLLCSLIALSAGAAAVEPAPVAKQVKALQHCRSVSDAAQRLACYDGAVDVLIAAAASQDVVIIERAEVSNARKGLFGFTLPRVGFLAGRDGNNEDKKDAQSLETIIVSSRSFGNGMWRFTIEGGATWETTEASSMARDPVSGASVLIEKGAFGSYFVQVGKGSRVRAKRIT
jgi:hypothetical protein